MMQERIRYRPFQIDFRLTRPESSVGIVALMIVLAIFQDYVYSQVQNTGFYLSESLLYNSIWAFLIPMCLLQIRFLKRFSLKRSFERWGMAIAMCGACTVLHIFLFSTFFVFVSYYAYSPPHHFSHIFNAAFSNQFYVLAIFYFCIPAIYRSREGTKLDKTSPIEDPEKVNVKVGSNTISLHVESIEFISTDKPYSVINSDGRRFLDNRTLRDFESLLTDGNFVRVHRSTIINKKFVMELKSRRNGDYDCVFQSGKVVRLSRHYRANWDDLLQ